MSNFWKILLGSCLGTLIALVAIFFIFFGSIVALSAGGEDSKSVSNNSVIELKLTPELQLPEKTNNVSGDGGFSLKKTTAVGLSDMIKTINAAKNDSKIKGIVLDCEGLAIPQATLTALRSALEDFRTSGKFIVSYSKYYPQKDYFLASVSDKMYLHPAGGVEFKGYGGQLTFFKGMLDRLDIKIQTYYAGQFKSATEPFRFEKMSEQNRLQTKEYMNGLYAIFLEKISKSRNIPVEDLKKYANDLTIRNADDAVNYHMIDAKGYKDELISDIKQRIGLGEKDKINTISMTDYYNNVKDDFSSSNKTKIAVVYCEGNIVEGKGAPGSIGGDKYADMIRKIRQDDNIKAIVVRMNSGGGSAIASESVWRELQLAKQGGKKIVCSMGDYAASGGYFIACAADSIFAEPNTITGSIGVFSMIPSFEKTMKTKLGITYDTVKTGKNSIGFSLFKDFSPDEAAFMQANTDRTYESFLQKVADGRHKTRDEIHAIAQGRVWLGTKGKEIGLVDYIGNLDQAIACAARMSGLSSYATKEYPEVKEPFEQFMENLTGSEDKTLSMKNSMIKSELGEFYGVYERIQMLKDLKGPQMKMYYDIEIK
jgi:protease IV